MVIFTSVEEAFGVFTLGAVIFPLMVILHIVTLFLRGNYAKILGFVNIVLHIFLLFPLLYIGAPIEETVLIYMISLFVYTASRFVLCRIGGKERKNDL